MIPLVRQLLTAVLSIIIAAPLCASTYDPVGNRMQKVSTLPGFPGGTSNYNANDQLATDTCDSDGNTTASNGVGYVYDFEKRLVQAGSGISYVYDGDGNRVQKTVAGVTTKYLVDDLNPTDYPQVVADEAVNNAVQAAYAYGPEQVVRERDYRDSGGRAVTEIIYYLHDGHGSARR